MFRAEEIASLCEFSVLSLADYFLLLEDNCFTILCGVCHTSTIFNWVFSSSFLLGLVLLPGGALGQILGGIIISKLHISSKGLMRFVIVTSAVSLVLLAFGGFVHCDPIPFAGITEDYGG